MAELYANNYQTTLNGAITSGATSITVNAAAPTALQGTGQFRIVIDGEILTVTNAGSTTTWSTVARGQEGTTAASHSSGAAVTHVLTSGALSAIIAGGGSAPAFGSTHATKTANYTLTTSDEVILADATSAAFALTLPTAVGFSSHFILKAINTNSNLVTLNTTSSQTIDGNASGTLTLGATGSSANYNSIIVVSDGSNWRIV